MHWLCPSITALTLFAHALVGCAWHSHGSDGACVEASTGHPAHHAAEHGHSHSAPHSPCEEAPDAPHLEHPDCSYVATELVKCPSLDLGAGFMLVAARLEAEAPRCGGGELPAGDAALEPHQRSRARRQVWLL